MNRRELMSEIVANYERHGWKLARVLTTADARPELAPHLPDDVSLIDSEIDALWFSRPSHGAREAWELRRLAEHPYALFEAFEADETEEDREEARQEMEHKMRDHAGR